MENITIETERRIISDIEESNIQTIETGLFERSKRITPNGEILYSDWKEKEGSRRKVKKVVMPKVIKKDVQQMTKEYLLGKRKVIEYVRPKRRCYCFFGPIYKIVRGRILQKRRILTQERTMLEYSNGKIEFTPWKLIKDEEREDVIEEFEEKR